MKQLALFGGKKTRVKPFEPYPVLGAEERQAVDEVLKTNRLSGFIASSGDAFLGGPMVRQLEEKIKDYFKTKFAVTVNSGTAGLHCALAALDLKPTDEVIVPPYTMSATATAVLMAGAVPVFCDIGENDYCLDPALIKKKITKHTKAIALVHLFGRPAKMDAIISVAKKHGIFIVEDCAQAPGAIYNKELVGTFGDIGVFSFNQHKTITTGEGGFAITNNKDLALKMQLIRNHGEAVVEGMGLDESFSGIVGYNYRMTELEAAVGLAQFSKLDELNKNRIELAEYLINALSDLKGLKFPAIDKGIKQVYFLLPIRVDKKSFGISRDQLADALVAEGIPFARGYVKPLYLLPLYQNGKNKKYYKKGLCPVAERFHFNELINSSPALFRAPASKSDMDDVIAAFKKIALNISEFD